MTGPSKKNLHPKTPPRLKAGDSIGLEPWLGQLTIAMRLARTSGDSDAVHLLRVALAHVQVWLALADHRLLRDELRWLRGCAAEVRDADVQLTQNPPPLLARRWRRHRVEAYTRLLTALDDPRCAALLKALALRPPVPRDHARRGMADLIRRALRRGARAKRHPHDVEALHALRRSLRRVRYALEWTEESTSGIAPLQDALGAVCDRALALRTSRGSSHRVRTYRRWTSRELRRAVRHARKLWKGVRSALRARRDESP